MSKILQVLLDWSEVWGLMIPINAYFKNRRQPDFMNPIVIYIWIALILNLAADGLMFYNQVYEGFTVSNNLIYNLHSIIRFACFSNFFILLKQTYFNKIKRWLPLVSLLFVIMNFTLVADEDIFNWNKLSGNLLSAEAYFLLIYCMLYYLSQLKEDVEIITSGKDFWITTGISFYVVINFFIFLFYDPMYDLAVKNNDNLVVKMWDVHNVAYVLLCIFIAKALYVPHPVRN